MRVTVEGRLWEELPTEFEPPPGSKDQKRATLAVQRHPTSSAIAMNLSGGITGVWDSATGKFLWAPGKEAGDIAWSPDGAEAFVLVNKFEYAGPRHVGHRLQRYDWPGCTLLEEIKIRVPSGGADRLVVSPSGRRGLVIAIDQGEWYYELLDLHPRLCQVGIGYQVSEWLGDCPAFSPDERYLVAVGSPGPLWWAPSASDWKTASVGGYHRLGTLYVHSFQRGRVREHPIVIDLPKGWLPKDPEDGQMWVVWGPTFRGPRAFRVWLPDGKPVALNLPLPKKIVVRNLRRRSAQASAAARNAGASAEETG